MTKKYSSGNVTHHKLDLKKEIKIIFQKSLHFEIYSFFDRSMSILKASLIV